MISLPLPVLLRHFPQFLHTVRTPPEHWHVIAWEFRTYPAKGRAVRPGAGVNRALTAVLPFLTASLRFMTAAAHALRPLFTAVAALAAGRDMPQIQLHRRLSSIRFFALTALDSPPGRGFPAA